MTDKTVREQVFCILAELCGFAVTGEEQSLTKDLFIDSLNMVMLLPNLEEAFGFQLKESDMNPYDLTTVGDVIRLAEKYEKYANE